jgi:murein L,D-transpeptidase YafK
MRHVIPQRPRFARHDAERQGLYAVLQYCRALMLALAAILVWPAAGLAETEAPALKADLVLVFKSERLLHLMHGGEIIRSYRVALGTQPDGQKVQEGDGRTPEGAYRLDWRNPDSNFHLSLHISYPGPRDVESATELGVEPGSLIMVHGLPNGMTARQVGHPQTDWTAGCIAVTNEEIEEIWALVDDGTAIVIMP